MCIHIKKFVPNGLQTPDFFIQLLFKNTDSRCDSSFTVLRNLNEDPFWHIIFYFKTGW